MSLKAFLRDFKPETIREGHDVELKREPDTRKCRLPKELKQDGCSHDLCRELRNVEIASDFAQFANADGGFIVYGAVENRKQRGATILGLDDMALQRRSIEQAFKGRCEPVPLVESESIDWEGKTALVYAVQPSVRPIWVKCPRDTLKIVRRIDESKMILGAAQVEEFVSDMSRANEIRLKQLHKEDTGKTGPSVVELAGGVVEKYDDLAGNGGGYGGGGVPPKEFVVPITSVVLTSCGMDEFELQITGKDAWLDQHSVRLPYSVLSHVWRTSEGGIGIVLGVRLIMRDKELCVVPQ